MTRHLGFPLLSFGRERPECVSTFTPDNPQVEEKVQNQHLHLSALFGRVDTRLALTHSRRIFRGFIPRLIFFTLLFSSIYYRLSSPNDGETVKLYPPERLRRSVHDFLHINAKHDPRGRPSTHPEECFRPRLPLTEGTIYHRDTRGCLVRAPPAHSRSTGPSTQAATGSGDGHSCHAGESVTSPRPAGRNTRATPRKGTVYNPGRPRAAANTPAGHRTGSTDSHNPPYDGTPVYKGTDNAPTSGRKFQKPLERAHATHTVADQIYEDRSSTSRPTSVRARTDLGNGLTSQSPDHLRKRIWLPLSDPSVRHGQKRRTPTGEKPDTATARGRHPTGTDDATCRNFTPGGATHTCTTTPGLGRPT